MNEILVSVVIPTYNRAAFLPRAIDSAITACEGLSFEILVVDDVSTDDTSDVVARYANRHVRYLPCMSKKGGGGARNIGMASASGRYIAFLDSDTIWNPDKIRRQLAILGGSPADVGGVYSLVRKITPDGQEIGIFPRVTHAENVHKNLLLDNFIDTPSAIVRREVIDAVGGFDPALPRFQDWEFFLRAAEKFTFIAINEPMLDSIELPDAISRNDAARVVALQHIFQKHYQSVSVQPAAYRRMVTKVVNAMILTGHAQAGRRFALSSRVPARDKALLVGASCMPAGAMKALNDLRKRVLARA
jgi:glycosyltransferase involved in cell wall biosynthesis